MKIHVAALSNQKGEFELLYAGLDPTAARKRYLECATPGRVELWEKPVPDLSKNNPVPANAPIPEPVKAAEPERKHRK